MNHKQFIDSNITQKTVILCEDLTDSKLYELFSYYFSQQNKLQILKQILKRKMEVEQILKETLTQ